MPRGSLTIEPDPDFGRIAAILRRDRAPDRVPFFELFVNPRADLSQAVWGGGPETPKPKPGAAPEDWAVEWRIRLMHRLGYDFATVHAKNCAFPQAERPQAATEWGEKRAYVQAAAHAIANREDFEKYPWPDMQRADYSPLEAAAKILPEGMKLIALGRGGILENTMWLLGYEGIIYLLFDDEAFVRDVFEAVAVRIIQLFDNLACFEAVGAVALGDDMGFKTQTLLSPAAMRKHVFPWHRKLVETVHRRGKFAILHSCGNRTAVMEDILDCGWDGLHSFEDAIEPVWEAKARHGRRIALLGGFDMDKICRMSEDEVRAHARFLIEQCGPGGGWGLGTGNSLPDYVPAQNYLAMLDEGWRHGRA